MRCLLLLRLLMRLILILRSLRKRTRLLVVIGIIIMSITDYQIGGLVDWRTCWYEKGEGEREEGT